MPSAHVSRPRRFRDRVWSRCRYRIACERDKCLKLRGASCAIPSKELYLPKFTALRISHSSKSPQLERDGEKTRRATESILSSHDFAMEKSNLWWISLLKEDYESQDMRASKFHYELGPALLKMSLPTMWSRGMALELVEKSEIFAVDLMAKPHALALLGTKLGGKEGLERLLEERPQESQPSEPQRWLPVHVIGGQKLNVYHVVDLVQTHLSDMAVGSGRAIPNELL